MYYHPVHLNLKKIPSFLDIFIWLTRRGNIGYNPIIFWWKFIKKYYVIFIISTMLANPFGIVVGFCKISSFIHLLF